MYVLEFVYIFKYTDCSLETFCYRKLSGLEWKALKIMPITHACIWPLQIIQRILIMFTGLTFDRQLSYGICVHWSLGLKMSYKLLIKTFITTMLGEIMLFEHGPANIPHNPFYLVICFWFVKKEYVVTYESNIYSDPEKHRILKFILIFSKTQLYRSGDFRKTW